MLQRKETGMRFYQLSILPISNQTNMNQIPSDKEKNSSRKKGEKKTIPETFTFSSYVKRAPDNSGFLPGLSTDQFDPGALDIQFDITHTDLTDIKEGHSDAAITIRGVDIYTINQASNLVGRTVSLQAGMGKGFPLSNPRQTGEILHGTVRGAIGNWEDTELSLTLFVTKYALSPDHLNDPSDQTDQKKPDTTKPATSKKPGKSGKQGSPPSTTDSDNTSQYQFNCHRGADLLTAISSALQQVNPDYQVIIDIPGLIPSMEEVSASYGSFKELCVAISNTWTNQNTGKDILITARETTFHVIDKNQDSSPHTIEFHELIGQPSWNGETEISFTCPMRGNIQVGEVITLPLQDKKEPQENAYGLIKKTQGTAALVPRNRCLFSGNFRVKSITHRGRFRDKDGRNWASTFTCEPCGNGASDKKSGTQKS